MAWPSAGYTLGDTEEAAEEARATWADVALAVSQFEPVTLVVDPADVAVARHWIDEGRHGRHRIDVLEAPLDDAWMRDIGPTFVLSGSGELGAVDWVFNGWGAQEWATWGRDARVGEFVTGRAGADAGRERPRQRGRRHPRRRPRQRCCSRRPCSSTPAATPGSTRADVEAEMARTIGATTCIWLPRGLTRDYDEFGHAGARRHRGDVRLARASCCCTGRRDPDHPDHEVSVELEGLLSSARDARGERAGGGARARTEDARGRRGSGRLVLHQPPRRQRRRRGVHVRRPPGRRLAGGHSSGRMPGAASSASTPVRSSTAAAASTASPSSNPAPDRRGHPSTGTVPDTSLR